MNTDYRARENNLSHFVNDGCYRCHGGEQVDEVGEALPADCTICHEIVAQGPSNDVADLESDIAGIDFIHPLDIGNVWETVKCTQCHTRESLVISVGPPVRVFCRGLCPTLRCCADSDGSVPPQGGRFLRRST